MNRLKALFSRRYVLSVLAVFYASTAWMDDAVSVAQMLATVMWVLAIPVSKAAQFVDYRLEVAALILVLLTGLHNYGFDEEVQFGVLVLSWIIGGMFVWRTKPHSDEPIESTG